MSKQETTRKPAAPWLEERGIVVELFEGGAWVEAQARSGCGSCTKSSCGTGLLARRHPSRLALHTNALLQVGDRVCLGLSVKSFLSGTLIVYGLPLLGAVLAGGLAETMISSGHVAVPFAFAGGLLAGCSISRHRLLRHQRQYQPILLAVESV
ncbi:SoxR reducing system RseC family protein [Halomonas sp. PR-M31]|uniref:SoxR reducing system RseC family protein n=1 Tax=Halomonas sp. PR-M31 TaxID=1471202 RepID=UPI0006507F24|nr:SoxR reducing system RseC family protein [Halomonas sp. PR-M31]